MRVHLLFCMCAYMWRPGGSLGWMSFFMCHLPVLSHDHSLGWNLPSRLDWLTAISLSPFLQFWDYTCVPPWPFLHTQACTLSCARMQAHYRMWGQLVGVGSLLLPDGFRRWNLASSVLCLSLPAPSVLSFLCYFLFREIVRQCLIIWTRLASHILLPPESWD